MMNQMTTNQMNQFRFTTLQGRTSMGGMLSNAGAEHENGNAGGHIGVDEMVFDSNSGTFASFQEPPALLSLLNSRDGACSFII